MQKKIQHDKGVAGLTILLSLIVMLFIIGLLITVFSLMGTELNESTYDTTSATTINESVASSKTAGLSATLTKSLLRDGSCGTITQVLNGTVDRTVIHVNNFTQAGCVITNASTMFPWHTALLFSYPYTWSAGNDATRTMNDTVQGLVGVTDWFAIFITIGAMVVLILLVTIIIVSIRGTGMMAGGSSGARDVGYA
jgi:uncharacterized membrane protein